MRNKEIHASVFENKSLSTNSATPNSRVFVSANATPTVRDFSFEEPASAFEEDAILIAITTGAETRSTLTKRRSSTAWRFPGDACDSLYHVLKGMHLSSRTSLSSRNFVAFLP